MGKKADYCILSSVFDRCAKFKENLIAQSRAKSSSKVDVTNKHTAEAIKKRQCRLASVEAKFYSIKRRNFLLESKH